MGKIKTISFIFTILLFFTWSGNTAEIHTAAQKGDFEKVKSLLNANPAQLNLSGPNGKSPLHWAAQGGHLKIVEYLIKRGAVVDSQNIIDETPLHYAAFMNHHQVVRLLIKKGASLNSKTTNGSTCLHYAVTSGGFAAVQTLIATGAEANIKDIYGRTPLDIAGDFNRNKIEKLLVSKGGIYTPIKDPEVHCLSKQIFRITFPQFPESNIGVSIGTEGILLVDSGFSNRAVPKLENTLKNLSEKKIKYIINTHLHWDHANGNRIGKKDTVIINYNKLDQLVSKGVLTKRNALQREKNHKTFNDYYIFQMNGEQIQLIPSPGIHTDADLIIYFTGSGVVHMGDLLLSQSFPSVANAQPYLEFMEKVVNEFPKNTLFISGHGWDLRKKELMAYHHMLLKTVKIVKQEMEAGNSIVDMQKKNLLKNYESYNSFIPELNTDFWINVVYTSYKDSI